jgi:hypothetical protein
MYDHKFFKQAAPANDPACGLSLGHAWNGVIKPIAGKNIALGKSLGAACLTRSFGFPRNGKNMRDLGQVLKRLPSNR